MLILTRRRHETIMIGADVEIMVVEVRGDCVKLGISAPKSTSVHREEVWLSINPQPVEVADCLKCGEIGHYIRPAYEGKERLICSTCGRVTMRGGTE